MRTCFSVMPFGDEFNDIDRIIETAAAECELHYVRGDRTNKPGSVISQVVHEIRRASVVVADITRSNPNVFYELGIAHQILGPERVVLISQSVTDPIYDIHQFRQLIYSHNEDGRRRLAAELPALIRRAADSAGHQEFWNIVRGRLPRTRLIVRDLHRVVESGTNLRGLTIRICAGLSSLAISDHEPGDHSLDTDYLDQLLLERDSLREVLVKGARLKAVLNPPRRFAQSMLPARLQARYQRMLGLLEGRSDIVNDAAAVEKDLAAIRQCDLVLSPVPVPNLWIIGDFVAYEGMKRGGSGGYAMTHCETDAAQLKEMIDSFEYFFDLSRRDMIRAHPPDGRITEQIRRFYEEAMSVA